MILSGSRWSETVAVSGPVPAEHVGELVQPLESGNAEADAGRVRVDLGGLPAAANLPEGAATLLRGPAGTVSQLTVAWILGGQASLRSGGQASLSGALERNR